MGEPSASTIGTVTNCWRYPVKSFQGFEVDHLEVGPNAIVGDRLYGVVDQTTGHLLAAKRMKQLLSGIAGEHTITLPDGLSLAVDDPDVDAALSRWLGRSVRLVHAPDVDAVSYEMTFDPPNEDAEYYEIPVPVGTLVDIAAVHVITTATLAACAEQRPDLDWDIRRFRPNVVIDVDVAPFGEQAWVGRDLTIGEAVLTTTMPMMRCSMPLRAQPGGIAKEPGIFQALSDLNEAFPNHLGLACNVVETGVVRVGESVSVSI